MVSRQRRCCVRCGHPCRRIAQIGLRFGKCQIVWLNQPRQPQCIAQHRTRVKVVMDYNGLPVSRAVNRCVRLCTQGWARCSLRLIHKNGSNRTSPACGIRFYGASTPSRSASLGTWAGSIRSKHSDSGPAFLRCCAEPGPPRCQTAHQGWLGCLGRGIPFEAAHPMRRMASAARPSPLGPRSTGGIGRISQSAEASGVVSS